VLACVEELCSMELDNAIQSHGVKMLREFWGILSSEK
jgi:hypothetical protein